MRRGYHRLTGADTVLTGGNAPAPDSGRFSSDLWRLRRRRAGARQGEKAPKRRSVRRVCPCRAMVRSDICIGLLPAARKRAQKLPIVSSSSVPSSSNWFLMYSSIFCILELALCNFPHSHKRVPFREPSSNFDFLANARKLIIAFSQLYAQKRKDFKHFCLKS